MVLINLNTLSDEEIRYIAEQEDLDGWDTLSREEIIENLEELYEESGEEKNTSDSIRLKYMNKLTNVNSDVSEFPGVSPVSSEYNETYIHMIPTDRNWVHAFWEINRNMLDEIQSEGWNLLISVKAIKSGRKPEESFEINITPSDRTWAIELPWTNRDYVLSIVCRKEEKDDVLCSTVKYHVSDVYLEKHPAELKNPTKYHILASPLMTKSGNVLNNVTVKEILKNA